VEDDAGVDDAERGGGDPVVRRRGRNPLVCCRMLAVMRIPEKMSDAERRVWKAYPTGQVADFQSGNAEADDPARGSSWDLGRQVRADVVAALLCNAVAVEPGSVARVSLRGARITGQIDLRDAELSCALWLDQCHVADGIDLTNARTRRVPLTRCYLGPVELAGASIGGDLSFNGAQLTAKDGAVINGAWLTVDRSMICDEIRADGEIRLRGATIGGDLTFLAAELTSRNGLALNAEGVSVGGDVLCRGVLRTYGDKNQHGQIIYFRAKGLVTLELARVSNLSILQAVLTELNAVMLTVTGLAQFGFQQERPHRLDGFTYGGLDPYRPAREQLRWLRQSVIYYDQPYEQLATYYRRIGRDEQARDVLLAKERARRKERPWDGVLQNVGWAWTRLWGWLQDGLVGYGYAPGRALTLLAVTYTAGWAFFRAHHPPPVSVHAHPSFNAAIYTLDLLVPAPGLGQTSDWNPQGDLLVAAIGLRLIGWLLAITVIAAITRSPSRN
jgi:hypothetical protein